MRRWLLFFLGIKAGLLWGQARVERSWLDSDTMMLGMPNRWHVTITLPADAALSVQPADTMQHLEWWGPPAMDTDSVAPDRLRLHVRLPFSGFDSGRFQPAAVWWVRDTTGAHSLDVPEPSVYIYWPAIDTGQGLQPVRPVLAPPVLPRVQALDRARQWWWLLLVAIVGMGGLLYWWRCRRKKAVPLEQQLSPYEYARYRLDRLAREKMWQKGKVRFYHTELSHIVRKFLEDEHGIPALEWASSELLAYLSRKAIPGAPDVLRPFLDLTDRVKFARYRPTEAENEQAMQWARQIVEAYRKPETSPTPEAPEAEEKS